MENIDLRYKRHLGRRGKRYILAGIIFLSIFAISLFYGLSERRARMQLENTVENSYSRAYYMLTESMDAIQTDMGKMIVTATPELLSELLTETGRKADQAINAIAQLPLSLEDTGDLIGFFNITGDFSRALMKKTAAGSPITYEETESIKRLHNAAVLLCSDFYEMQRSRNWGLGDETQQALSSFIGTDVNSLLKARLSAGIQMPTLIYDGPFSENLIYREPQGLGKEQIDAAECLSIVSEKLSLSQVLLNGETEGFIPSYTLTGTGINGSTVYAQISRQGGEVVMMIEETGACEELKSEEECCAYAKEYLSLLGIGEVVSTWAQKSDGMIVFNFAPVHNDVVMYPDLIKVKVSMEDGHIAAYDAKAYWMNHHERRITFYRLSMEDAAVNLSTDLEVLSSRMCIIPLPGGEEQLCYEYITQYAKETYILYLDVRTGEEVEVLKIVNSENGKLTV